MGTTYENSDIAKRTFPGGILVNHSTHVLNVVTIDVEGTNAKLSFFQLAPRHLIPSLCPKFQNVKKWNNENEKK